MQTATFFLSFTITTTNVLYLLAGIAQPIPYTAQLPAFDFHSRVLIFPIFILALYTYIKGT